MVASQDEGAAPTYFERERERLVAEIAGVRFFILTHRVSRR